MGLKRRGPQFYGGKKIVEALLPVKKGLKFGTREFNVSGPLRGKNGLFRGKDPPLEKIGEFK